MKPPSLRVCRSSRVTESGFASVVTSAPSTRPNTSMAACRMRTRSRAGSLVGCRLRRRRCAWGVLRRRMLRGAGGEEDFCDGVVGVGAEADTVAEVFGGVGVEVAVAAAYGAEGDVYVEAEVAGFASCRAGGGDAPVAGAGSPVGWAGILPPGGGCTSSESNMGTAHAAMRVAPMGGGINR